jgi:hypothetical protein
MPYTIKLIALECFSAEEVDGDEVYLKLNGSVIWKADPDKLIHHPDAPHHVSQFDFANGRKLTAEGWLPMMPYNPDDFIFKDQTGGSVVQLWDADVLTNDDLLGQTPIDETQAGGGHISVVFRRLGGHYRLTYQVEV